MEDSIFYLVVTFPAGKAKKKLHNPKATAERRSLFFFVICAVFFDVYANCIDPVNTSLYDSFVKRYERLLQREMRSLGSKRIGSFICDSLGRRKTYGTKGNLKQVPPLAGLSGAAVLVANLVLTGTTIAFQQEGEVNHALGIEGSDASYGGTEFSADGTLSDASYEKYIEAAYQFCEQEEEEGSVLLYNRNNALPLSESERNVTVFGRGSIDPVFRSTAGGSSTNPDYQKTPVDALQDAGFNVNQTVLDAYASAAAPKERSVSSVGEYDPALFTGSVTDSFASYGDVALLRCPLATEATTLRWSTTRQAYAGAGRQREGNLPEIKDSGKFKKPSSC